MAERLSSEPTVLAPVEKEINEKLAAEDRMVEVFGFGTNGDGYDEIHELQVKVMTLEQERDDLQQQAMLDDDVRQLQALALRQHRQLLQIIRRLWENPELRRIVDAGLTHDWDQALDYNRKTT